MKNSLKQLIVLGAVVVTLSGCGWFGGMVNKVTGLGVETITADELKTSMEESVRLIVINVLSAENYTDCHIEGSNNVPLEQLEVAAGQWHKDMEIVVYCASFECHASRNAYKKLRKLGFKNVKEFSGGMKKWLKKDYPVTGPCAKDYLK